MDPDDESAALAHQQELDHEERGALDAMLDPDTWRQIRGSPAYWVSTHGQIISTMKRRPRMIAPIKSGKYLAITYWDSEHRRHREYVHRLVLKTWVGDPRPGQEAGHLNGNRHDNRLANLAWVTRQENANHRIIHGTVGVGASNPMAVLTDEKVRSMRADRIAGMPYYKIAAKYNVSTMTAHRAITRTSWRHIE